MDHKHHEHMENGHEHHKVISSGSNPCTDKLTDIEYLEHMIAHHQVASDMSNMLIPHTNNAEILHLCRDIIRKQGYEIWEMNFMKEGLAQTVFDSDPWTVDKGVTKLDVFEPVMSKSKDGQCNPLFFKPNDHSAHMKGMKITEKSYLEHMIPHHQVAIDMSKRLLLHTNHSYLMEFCRKLIIEQQGEIYTMNNLLRNEYNYKSELLE